MDVGNKADDDLSLIRIVVDEGFFGCVLTPQRSITV